ncbi:MAG: GTPase [Candidatus Hodarchaeota archaeon]
MDSKAILCLLNTNPHDHIQFKVKLAELEKLATAAGFDVVGRLIQTRIKPTSKFLMGSGKIRELEEIVKSKKLDFAVFYNVLSSKQLFNLTRKLGCEVIDRYDLTLKIFEMAATDRLSKLQIESAMLKKILPYLKLEASARFSKDHPFFRSMGEYAFHSKMKGLTKRISRIRREMNKLLSDKSIRIEKRKKLNTPTVCISGFYNAGKTTLFNALTGEDKPVSDQPFTTLSSKYQKSLDGGPFLFIDTIGFVFDLYPELIKSFELNLLDMKLADIVLLLIGVDETPEVVLLKLRWGINLLRELGIDSRKILITLNKQDYLTHNEEMQLVEYLGPFLESFDYVFVSAKNNELDNFLMVLQKKIESLDKRES